MGTWSSIGGSYRTAWFTESDPTAGVERMAAVVVRRVDPSLAGETTNFRDLLRLLRWVILHKLRLGRWAGPPANGPWQLPDGWNGGVDHGQVLYSGDRRLVRVRGRDYALPGNDQTLIVLVDETVPGGVASIETRAVMAPLARWLPLDPKADREENLRRVHERSRASGAVWNEWLEHEPSICAFIGDARS
jgi:hypothetical protein